LFILNNKKIELAFEGASAELQAKISYFLIGERNVYRKKKI
jgi:hypothetical protein